MVPPGFDAGYRVELLYSKPPSLDPGAIQKELTSSLPESEVKELKQGDLSVAHKGHTVKFADGEGKPMTAVFVARDRPVSQEEFRQALEQTWSWPREDARARTDRSRFRVVVMDLLSLGLPYQARLRLVFNVRLFRVDDRPGEIVMDTLGLAALGVPDLQCHFKGLEVSRLAGFLRGVGTYVFEKGDVIGDGNTVQGLEPSQRWACRHEMALIAPARVVIDIDPGPPYSTRG